MTVSAPLSGDNACGHQWAPTTTRMHSMKMTAAFNGTVQNLFNTVLSRKGAEDGTLVEMRFVVKAGLLLIDVGTFTYSVPLNDEYVIRAEGYDIDMAQAVAMTLDGSTLPEVHVHTRFLSNSPVVSPI